MKPGHILASPSFPSLEANSAIEKFRVYFSIGSQLNMLNIIFSGTLSMQYIRSSKDLTTIVIAPCL